MVDINNTILQKIEENLNHYNCTRTEIEKSLESGLKEKQRQERIEKIIREIMSRHGKEELYGYIIELGNVERGTRTLKGWFRDHVFHTLQTFLLGIYIDKFFLKDSLKNNDLRFQWKLASLFHDVGYPLQIAKDIVEPYTKNVNDIRQKVGISNKIIKFKILPLGIEELNNDINALDLIQNRLNDWNLEIDVKKIYDKMIKSGNIDHGIISSLSILNVLDSMYQKNNPKREHKYINVNNSDCNQSHFEKDIVSACSAIFIHSLDEKYFQEAKIDRDKAPIAFLLKLADALQEYERPSALKERFFSSNQFNLKFEENKLKLSANIPSDKKQKIRKEIKDYLIADDVEII